MTLDKLKNCGIIRELKLTKVWRNEMKYGIGEKCDLGTVVRIRNIVKNPLKVKTMLFAEKCPRSRFLLTVRDRLGHYHQVYDAVVEEQPKNLVNVKAMRASLGMK